MNNIPPDDEPKVSADLVRRIIDGDRTASDEMVIRYGRWLVTLLANRCHDRYLADDVAQETWVIILTKVPQGDLRDHAKLRSFIRNVAVNQLTMAYRKRTGRREDSDAVLETHADKGLTPEQVLKNKQLGEVIDVMFDDMSTKRDAILLREHYLRGNSKLEISARYELTSAQFDRISHRARQRFIKLWNEKFGSDNPLN